MKQFIIVLLIVALFAPSSFAEPPVVNRGGYGRSSFTASDTPVGPQIVDAALLQQVAQIINSGEGPGGKTNQENEGSQLVDTDLLERIAAILMENEASVGGGNGRASNSAPSANYGAPDSYAAPQAQTPISKQFELGVPIPAERIASWDIGDDNSMSTSFSPSSYQVPPRNSYMTDSYAAAPRSGSPSGSIELGMPQLAERIASFDTSSNNGNTNSYRPPQARGSY